MGKAFRPYAGGSGISHVKTLALLVGFLVLGGLAGAYLLPLLTSPAPPTPLTLQAPCDLNQSPCVASDAAGRSIRLQFSPTPIPLLQDIRVQAVPAGFAAMSKAQLRVEGVTMFMGYQDSTLIPDAAGQLHGKLMLPICSLQQMQWLARVELDTATGRFVAEFTFNTTRH